MGSLHHFISLHPVAYCFLPLRSRTQKRRDIDYVHLPVLAPSADILAAFGKHKKDWPVYELAFLDLMRKREIEKQIDPAVIKGGCLLCSEATPHYCHRRLIVDYLQRHWGDLTVQHLA